MKIVYLSLVDLSMSSGPSVNERGFIKDMSLRFGGGFLALVPKPKGLLPNDLDGCFVRYINSVPGSKTFFGWFESRLIGCFKAQCYINSFEPDIIVMRTGALAIPQWWVALKNPDIPFVLKTEGGGGYESFYQRGFGRRLTYGANERIQEALIQKAQHVDAVSNMHVESLRAYFPDFSSKIHHIDNGVDTSLFRIDTRERVRAKFGWAEKDIVLGYAGSQPYKRGARELIYCVAENRDQGVYGMVIGGLSDDDECVCLSRKLNVEHLVTFMGEVDFLEVADLMPAFDVGVSLRYQYERSCSELKVRQYLATGAFVIGTAGSNDFLAEKSFARVIQDNTVELTLKAFNDFAKIPLDERKNLRRLATRFANEELSIAARNDQRLHLWGICPVGG